MICPKNSKITKFNIKSGDYVDSIGIECADGTKFPQVGGTSGVLRTITTDNANGFDIFSVKSGNWVDSL
jgi:hypothetical protein